MSPVLPPSEWNTSYCTSGGVGNYGSTSRDFGGESSADSLRLVDPTSLRLLVDGLLAVGASIDKVRKTLARSGYARADIDLALSAAGAFDAESGQEQPARAIALDGKLR